MNLKSLIYPWPPLGAILAWVAVAVLSSVTISARADDPAGKGDRGIVMCFKQEDGQFLWQTVHEFPANLDQQGRNQGIASSPAVDGNRVYYVSNACELVCADAAPETKERIIWPLDMMK